MNKRLLVSFAVVLVAFYACVVYPLKQRKAEKLSSWSQTGKELVFLHIPKNAGTAIEELGLAFNLHWGRYAATALKKRQNARFKKCVFHHMPIAYQFQGSTTVRYHCRGSIPWKLTEDGWPVLNRSAGANLDVANFCVIRHPYERAISEFKYRMKNKKGSAA
eukprot:6359384-Amphidinium_carterae.1